jgi:HEPN domain-containing protein
MDDSQKAQASVWEIRAEFRKRMAAAGLADESTLPESARAPLSTARDINMARQYWAAAAVIHEASNPASAFLSNPWFQLVGQSLELAFKAAIAASGDDRPGGHDLCALCERAEKLGLELGDPHARAIVVHIDHTYHKDINTDAKYAARYGESGGGIVPPHERVAAVVLRLCEQAERLNQVRLASTAHPERSQRAR